MGSTAASAASAARTRDSDEGKRRAVVFSVLAESFGPISLTDALTNSVNTVFAQVGERVGRTTLVDYMKRFGWGQATGIEMPAESDGILYPPSSWDDRTRYTTMFGQGYTVTSLHTAHQYNGDFLVSVGCRALLDKRLVLRHPHSLLWQPAIICTKQLYSQHCRHE